MFMNRCFKGLEFGLDDVLGCGETRLEAFNQFVCSFEDLILLSQRLGLATHVRLDSDHPSTHTQFLKVFGLVVMVRAASG